MRSLPNNWQLTDLAGIAAPIKNAIVDGPFGSNLKTSDYVDQGVPVLQGKNITKDSFRWFDVRYIGEKKAEELKRSSARVGDILIVKIGSIGYSAILDDLNGHDFAIIPANLAKLTIDKKIADLRYVQRWLTSTEAKRYLVINASKTAQPALNLTKLKKLPIPLPPLDEQKRIAEVLDKADALRQKRRLALQKLDSLLRSVFLDMFGDPNYNPKGLSQTRFGDVFASVRYGTGSPPVYVESGHPFIRATNIKKGTVIPRDLKFISDDDAKKITKCRVSFGDLVVVRSGVNSGDSAMIPKELDGAYAAYDLVVELDYQDAVFYNFLINSEFGNQAMRKVTRRAAQPHLNADQLREMVVIRPSEPSRDHFVSVHEKISEIRNKLSSELEKHNQLFNSIQQRAFKGELFRAVSDATQ